MQHHIGRFVLAGTAILLALSSGFANAADKIRLAQNLAPISGLAIIAKQKNLFEKYGLDVAVNNFTSGRQALETVLGGSKETGKFAQGDQLTIADICLCGQAVGAAYFKCDIAAYPTFKRIVEECNKIEAVARAHPLKQPGAPAAA